MLFFVCTTVASKTPWMTSDSNTCTRKQRPRPSSFNQKLLNGRWCQFWQSLKQQLSHFFKSKNVLGRPVAIACDAVAENVEYIVQWHAHRLGEYLVIFRHLHLQTLILSLNQNVTTHQMKVDMKYIMYTFGNVITAENDWILVITIIIIIITLICL